MKMPKSPPSFSELVSKLGSPGIDVVEVMSQVPKPTVDGRYVHWDKLRYLEAPGDFDHHFWWFGLKLRRMAGSVKIPFRDKSGDMFSFNIVDPLPETLHHVDSFARGAIQVPEPVANPATRDQYIMRSLMEEAIRSSQLEGASTTRAVAKQMIREGRAPRDRGEQMIANNFRTMREIRELKDESLTGDLVFEIHRMVTDRTLDDPSGSGRFRRSEEEIRVVDELGEVFHTPPAARDLDRRLREMCDFANGLTPSGFVHPLIRSMTLHFWLAYDHPFIDGNGRTARALFYWSMLRSGYWLVEFITISKIILRGPMKYGRAFLYTETDDNDLTYFLLYHAQVVRRAIDELHAYINRRAEQVRRAEAELRGLMALNHRQRDLIGHALRHPGEGYTIDSHRNSHDIVYETARSDMMDLADRGLLIRRKIGKAYHFYPSPRLEEQLKNL